ncbi:MAG: hypothetical protein COA82_00045 [Alkaliphilus sp.]|nr:DUF2326 domain-containing protein [bacterium AH-315-G05]MBN4074714.1 DUF2326 domain-containing protein [bacterium AH-315-E09]PHS36408.1 MAG: hypothetical protein COA82_00045 [Alkaliphilus sp.]
MFIKELKIIGKGIVIRKIKFHKGINLIVDETPTTDEKSTGNNVGKTTVLKLIDFCLGAKASIIYTDEENKKDIYLLVKEYLIEHKILIILTLTEDLDSLDVKEIFIERNFLLRKETIRKINGIQYSEKEFETELLKLIIPGHKLEKPSLRQIISHNIRHKNETLNNTLKTLSSYTTDVEYETLYLFLLGCDFDGGSKKYTILAEIKQEIKYKKRLEKTQTRNAYEIALTIIDDEITELNKKKSNFNLNENFEVDLDNLNKIKWRINKKSSKISNLKIRLDLINEAREEMRNNTSQIDLRQLRMIYEQAVQNIMGIQKTFEDLVAYHNGMILEKIKFISAELPSLEKNIKNEDSALNRLLQEEKELINKISKSETFEELEVLIIELNEKHKSKGEYEAIVAQIEEVENNIKKYNIELEIIEDELFTGNFESKLKSRLTKFNKYFSEVSNELYGEKYALKYDVIVNKENKKIYKFSAFNANLSSGKKQGEIVCFDLAYILFADNEKISCLHFLLNDKKELMHGNQLVKISEFIRNKNIQLVFSILKDKLPKEIDVEKNIIIRLSQDSKLFKIESN